jgi:hypothetical protein
MNEFLKFVFYSSGLVWLSAQLILSWGYQNPGDGRSTVRNEIFMIHYPSGYSTISKKLIFIIYLQEDKNHFDLKSIMKNPPLKI